MKIDKVSQLLRVIRLTKIGGLVLFTALFNPYDSYRSIAAEDLAVVSLNQGMIEFKNHHNSAAISKFNQALRVNPKYAAAYYNLGLVYADRYNNTPIDDTDALLECSIQRNPSLQVFCRHLISYEWQQRQQQRAIFNFTKAMELQPQYPEAYHARGSVHLPNIKKASDDWQYALTLWQQALNREQAASQASEKTRNLARFSIQIEQILEISRKIDRLKYEIDRQKNPGSPSGYAAIDKYLREEIQKLYAEAHRLLVKGDTRGARDKYRKIESILARNNQLKEYQEVKRTIDRLDRSKLNKYN